MSDETLSLVVCDPAWIALAVSIGGPAVLWAIVAVLAYFRSPGAIFGAIPAAVFTVPAFLNRFPDRVVVDRTNRTLAMQLRGSEVTIRLTSLVGPTEVWTPGTDQTRIRFGITGSAISYVMTVDGSQARRFIAGVAQLREGPQSAGQSDATVLQETATPPAT